MLEFNSADRAKFSAAFPTRNTRGAWTSRRLSTRVSVAVLWGLATCLSVGSAPMEAGEAKFLIVETAQDAFLARLVRLADEDAWFLKPDGALAHHALGELRSIERRDEVFTPWNKARVRDQLRRELPGELSFGGGPQYLVCARPDVIDSSSRILDECYGQFSRYFRTRGFDLEECEFPLVVIVLPGRLAFDAYCRRDGVVPRRELQGYYSPSTNRVVTYSDLIVRRVSQNTVSEAGLEQNLPAAVGQASTGFEQLLIHEAIHQLAYNRGLHGRMAQNPRWIVEGLATTLESIAILDGDRNPSRDVNAGRLDWWRRYRSSSDQPITLAELVVDERLFTTRTLDAYSESWAWNYFLLQTRPTEYARYLKLLAERPSGEDYRPRQRLDDFKLVFGGDLMRLQQRFERFMAEL